MLHEGLGPDRVLLLQNREIAHLPTQGGDVVRPRNQLDLPVLMKCLNQTEAESVRVMVLVDSGCTQSCIDREYAEACGFLQQPLNKPIRVLNADGTPN